MDFVEATGPIYVGKLPGDALGISSASASEEPAPRLDPALDRATKITIADKVLRAMSLMTSFARLVLLVGGLPYHLIEGGVHVMRIVDGARDLLQLDWPQE